MRLRLLAADFDTVAVDGRIDKDVSEALREARGSGVLTVLTSRRFLSELQLLLPAPDLFDAIVAENGAVLQVSGDSCPVSLSQGLDGALLAELTRRGVAHRCGLCTAEAAAAASHEVLGILQALALPYGISLDQDHLVVFAHGTSRANGLREAAWRLGASLHNAVAISGAGDDPPLLSSCEMGLAVGWGSDALKPHANDVIQGDGPWAAAPYIRKLLSMGRIPLGHHRLRMGRRETGEVVEVVLRGRNAVIAGDPKSGKSWLAGLLGEELILKRYSLCILDPEGDYTHLDALPGVIVYRLREDKDPVAALELILRQPALSLVVDMSALPPRAKPALVRELLQRVNSLRRALGAPHRVVIDEAHYFLCSPDDAELFDPELGGYVLVTYRVADLSAAVLSQSEVIIVRKVADRRVAADLLALVSGIPPSSEWVDSLTGLKIDEAVLLLPGSAESALITSFRIDARRTGHVRHRQKYVDVPVRPGEEFVFTRQGCATDRRARTVGEFFYILSEVPEEVFSAHLRRGDFHRWIEEVLGDDELGETIRSLENESVVSEARASILRAIEDRYLVSVAKR
ncbi:MAG TPA: hypothetical protein DEP35_03545 [Deltaproteobacteria bacterium]|nr:hypothetical protein [Deltaproteobacteria bacterium]